MKTIFKYLAKSMLIFISLTFLSGKCDFDGPADGSPIVGMLVAPWRLEKIVTPTQTLTASQIGYNELLDITSENGYTVENTYRNDSLIEKQYWGPYDGHVIDSKQLTFLMKYRYDAKRYYRILRVKMEGELMEASGYVSEIGAPEDTVRYFYKEVFPR